MSDKPVMDGGACCPKSVSGVTQLRLAQGGRTVGIVGLDTVFEQLLAMGRAPDEATDTELVGMVRAHNYVPSSASVEATYAAALRRAYAAFYARRQSLFKS
jgi:hypothetical protein